MTVSSATGSAPNVEALRKVYLFATLSPQELKFLSGVIKRREFRSGHTVFREGDAAVSLFFVESGSVKVVKANPHGGDPIILTSLGVGTLFGEIPFVAGGARTANIMCTEYAVTYEITYDEMERLSQLNPQFGVKLYKALASYLAKCLKHTTQEMAGPKPQVKAAVARTGNTGFTQRPAPVAAPAPQYAAPQAQYSPQPQQQQPQYAPPPLQQPQYAPPQAVPQRQPQSVPQRQPQAVPQRQGAPAPTQIPRPQGYMSTQPAPYAPPQMVPQPPVMGVGPTVESPGARTSNSGEIIIELDE